MQTLSVRLLSLSEVQKAIPYSTSQIWRLEQAGKFPKRIKLGANRVAWAADEIQDWIASKMEARDNAKDS